MPRPKKTEEEKKTIKSPVRAKKIATVDQPEPEQKKKVRRTYLYAVGRRKKSIARVRLYKNGTGKITINEKDYAQYFPVPTLQQIVKRPLEVVSKLNDFDFSIKVVGGGVHGQAEACRHGISRVLLVFDNELKPLLKVEKLLRRDPRRKERKKPGLKRARRAPQWSKR